MIQSLPKTVGINIDQMIILDSLRKQRNVADYSGDQVTNTTMEECLNQAEALLKEVTSWLNSEHPELT